MRELLVKVHELAKEQMPKMQEASRKVCISCGECCSDSVRFFKPEIKQLKAKYKKLFRGVDLVDHGNGEYRLFKRKHTDGGSGNYPCVFYDTSSRKCKVYEDRPLICRLYGQSPIATCGYEGLDTLPTDVNERRDLAIMAKEFNIATMTSLSVRYNAFNK